MSDPKAFHLGTCTSETGCLDICKCECHLPPMPQNAPRAVNPNNLRCCFNEMVPDLINTLTTDFDRTRFVCSECRMAWIVTRIQLSILFTPLGIVPLIQTTTEMPKGMSS